MLRSAVAAHDCTTMVSTSLITLTFLVCLQTVLLFTVSNCAKTITMYWNTTNSIFRIDNTDHILDVNKNNAAFEYDQVNIICPVYQPGTYDDEVEKYIIYNVSKEEYETCRITNPSPRVIAVCDKPFKTMYFTITFRPFTPQPGGLEFHPGHDYYFISTSSREDLHRRIGGRCTTHNMKVVFKVCCNTQIDFNRYPDVSFNNSNTVAIITQSNNSSLTSAVVLNPHVKSNNVNTINDNLNQEAIVKGRMDSPVNIPLSINSKSSDRLYLGNGVHLGARDGHEYLPPESKVESAGGSNIVSPSLSHVPQPPIFPNYPPQIPIYPAQPLPASQPPKISITQRKKSKEYLDHSNEVVKNEELTYNSGSSSMTQRVTWNRQHQLTWITHFSLIMLLPYLLR